MTKEEFLERMMYQAADGRKKVVPDLRGFYRRVKAGPWSYSDYNLRLLIEKVDKEVEAYNRRNG